MKVLATYDEKLYLVETNSTYRHAIAQKVWEKHSEGKYRDECHEKEWVIRGMREIAVMGDDSTIVQAL